jgi:2-hydroxy-3-oxopropionate reductase
MPERIGFIGLGVMGRPMCKHLLDAGYPVVAYDIMKAGVDYAVSVGATAAASNKEVAQKSDVVITMLPDSPDVEACYQGANGVLDGAHRGLVAIDMSSISPVTARKVAAAAAEKGAEMIDAPVSGGQVGAEQASLAIMCGGKQAVFDKVLPILQKMGKNITLVGEAGAGQVTKAANQIIVAMGIQAVAEAMVLAQKAGVDPAKVRQALAGGYANSRILEVHGQKMLDRNFAPGFRIRLHIKDLNVALSTGREYGVALPGTANAMEILKALGANGHIDEDHSAIVKWIEMMANTEVKPGS